jgi:Aspartate/ornithine carbamoyltransferase, carbamoyl-P binding domain
MGTTCVTAAFSRGSTSNRARCAICYGWPKRSSWPSTPTPRGGGLAGKEIALIFEKTSTRTRSAFEVAAYDEGAHVTYLDPAGSQLGHKESIADTAAVLGRMYDAIEYRGTRQVNVEALSEHAGVPVYNGCTDGQRRPDHGGHQAARSTCPTSTPPARPVTRPG